MRPLPALALTFVLLLAPVASAGTADAPEMTDAAGDAGPNGVATPAGSEDVDILAAWFEGETDDALGVMIKTAAAFRNRPNTVWAQRLSAGDLSVDVGFVNFLPFYTGTFVCKVEGQQNTACEGVEGSWSGDVISLMLPKTYLDNATAGTPVRITGGGSFTAIFAPVPGVPVGTGFAYDMTPEGIPYILAKGEGADNLTDAETPPIADAAADAGSTIRPTNTSGSGGAAETPAAPFALVAGLLVFAALALRRRS